MVIKTQLLCTQLKSQLETSEDKTDAKVREAEGGRRRQWHGLRQNSTGKEKSTRTPGKATDRR